MDYVTETVKKFPEKVTSAAGLDDFVAKVPMQEYGKDVETMYAGKKRKVSVNARHPFYEDLALNEKGEVATDASGNPIGLDVVSEALVGDDGKPVVNPETKQPYKVLAKDRFNAVMQHNPDIADFVRGQVNSHFRELGADNPPQEGTEQWNLMARAILRDELKTRSKSYFKINERESKTAPLTRIELGYPAYGSTGGRKEEKEAEINDVYAGIESAVTQAADEYAAGNNSVNYILGSQLEDAAQEIVQKRLPSDYALSEVKLIKKPDGKIGLYSVEDGKILSTLTMTGINIKAQPSVKEKREVIKKDGKPTKSDKDPLGIL
jgi:hypothetical protein